jgi:hypothetical protein
MALTFELDLQPFTDATDSAHFCYALDFVPESAGQSNSVPGAKGFGHAR